MGLPGDVKTPGEMLQEARESRVMTIEQLSGITKIPERLLNALERDEHHKLSEPLYVKSFLRTYAGPVGLDPHEIVAVYETQAGLIAPAGAPLPSGATTNKKSTASAPTKGRSAKGKPTAVTPPGVGPVSVASKKESPDTTIALEVEVQRVGIAYGHLLFRGGLVVIALVAIAFVVWFLATGKLASSGDGGGGGEIGRPAVESLLSTAENLPTVAAEVTPEAATEADVPASPEPITNREADPEGIGNDAGPEDEIATDGGARVVDAAASRRLGSTTISPEQLLASSDRLAGAWMNADRPEFPRARRGDRRIDFRDQGARDLVLRLICQQPVSIRVAVDGGTAQPVAWPPVDRVGRLPAWRVAAGEPYAVRRGLVVYWGAAQRFAILLGRTEGIELTLNGLPLAPEDLPVGEEIVLDASSVRAAAGGASGP